MKFGYILFILGLTTLCMPLDTAAQQKNNTPKVFLTGEYEQSYDQIVKEYNQMLLAVCNNDLSKSFEIWTDFLRELEVFAAQSGQDLKGVKLWINVFWTKDGLVDHIVFYPKPNSKNLKYENLKPIFEAFVDSYQTPLKHTAKFSHYGSANFPIISKSFIGNNKQ